jgi:membrane-associated phospholipid phosphatase
MAFKEKVWLVLLFIALFLTVAAGKWTSFPGDLTLTQLVQSITPASTVWAERISSTAKSPWSMVLLAVTVGISWTVAGRCAALLALASFGGMWVLGKWLGPVIGRPRPSPALVRVAEQLSGFSFPSVFALTYASTVGFLAILLAVKTTGAARMAVMIVCCLLLLVGWAARISLAAHWPSDVALSCLIGVLWAAFLIRFV